MITGIYYKRIVYTEKGPADHTAGALFLKMGLAVLNIFTQFIYLYKSSKLKEERSEN